MTRLKFQMHQAFDDSGIKMAFTDGKGRTSSTYFSSPPESIDHVGPEYLAGRFNNVKGARHEKFIKSEYKRLMATRNLPNEFIRDEQIKELLHKELDEATPLQRIKMAQWLGVDVANAASTIDENTAETVTSESR